MKRVEGELEGGGKLARQTTKSPPPPIPHPVAPISYSQQSWESLLMKNERIAINVSGLLLMSGDAVVWTAARDALQTEPPRDSFNTALKITARRSFSSLGAPPGHRRRRRHLRAPRCVRARPPARSHTPRSLRFNGSRPERPGSWS